MRWNLLAHGRLRVFSSVIAILGLVWLALAGSVKLAAAPAEPGLLDFIRAQGERRYTKVPREVLAFYYTWYGTPETQGRSVHWGRINPEEHDISESTHYPARGAYDSQDPAVIDAHIDLAKQHHLTGFIATWWGQDTYDDRAFAILLDRAEYKGFKVTTYWETAPGKDRAQIDKAVSDLAYLVTCYGKSRAFLKVDGKPVIFVYGRVMGEVPPASWPVIVTEARARVGDFLLIADGCSESYARRFDGVHTYTICRWVQNKTPEELSALSAREFASDVAVAKKRARISCLTLIPGYDNTKIREPGINAERQNGQTYRVLWQEAIKAEPDWVIINSWNEWHSGSEIEPSWEDGDKYLKITGEYASRFRTHPFSTVSVPASSSNLAPDKARQLRELYAGRTIGLLPGYGGDAPLWLLDAGLTMRELSWADLLDPAKLNRRNVPLLLYAGGERYVRTVKSENDVEQALQRYLGEGGFLACIPHFAWPFYYDESAGKPAPITSPLGLPIAGGWERPPADTTLAFQVDTRALPGLPATVSFPGGGDLRWRSTKRSAAPKDSLYVPLATLKDASGQSLGEGIAYVELNTPPLRNGKTLYVWMRMPDVLGVNEGLFALFRFAAEKLGPR